MTFPLPVVGVATGTSGRDGTGGVLFTEVVEMFEGGLGRDMELREGPRGVTRCLLEDAFSAGESGRNLGLEVRMNVWISARLFREIGTYIWVLVVYTTQSTGEKQKLLDQFLNRGGVLDSPDQAYPYPFYRSRSR
jgi:hypothetical protein